MGTTVEDVTNAQIKSRENLDETKNCGTCEHSLKDLDETPCDTCIDSFIGIVFAPSNWESARP